MPKLKIEKDEEIQEGEVVESVWDFKKILIGSFLFLVIGLICLVVFFPGEQRRGPSTQTLGESTIKSSKPTPPLPNREDIEGIIDSAKNTLSGITSENMDSSASAIQKVISDLQALQGSGSAIDKFCDFMCKK